MHCVADKFRFIEALEGEVISNNKTYEFLFIINLLIEYLSILLYIEMLLSSIILQKILETKNYEGKFPTYEFNKIF